MSTIKLFGTVISVENEVKHNSIPEMIKKGVWCSEEDGILLENVKKYGPKEWNSLRSKGILNRMGKQRQLRWVTQLQPNLKKGTFFETEKQLIFDLQKRYGNKWKK